MIPSPQQDRVLREIDAWLRSSGPQWRYLAGPAGTGKTSIARFLQQDRRVAYACYTGKGAHVLRSKGCEGATTLHKLIYKPDERAVVGEDGTTRYKTEFVARELDDTGIAEADLVVLDEMSMCNDRLAQDLLSYGKRVLVCGDPHQLPPINGEGYFTRREPDYVLTEIHRQARESGILRLATDVREGRGIGDPDSYGPDAAIVSMEQADESEAELLDWCDVVIVGTHRWRHHFNKRYRERAGLTSYYPQVGDQLICLANDHRRGLLNGSIWVTLAPAHESGHMTLDLMVREVEEDRRTARDDGNAILADSWAHDFVGKEGDFESMPWRRRAERARFAYGYAITAHKAQGSQFSRVLALDESEVFRDQGSKWLYTTVSRASTGLVLVRR